MPKNLAPFGNSFSFMSNKLSARAKSGVGRFGKCDLSPSGKTPNDVTWHRVCDVTLLCDTVPHDVMFNDTRTYNRDVTSSLAVS